jgi:hypothetical protein
MTDRYYALTVVLETDLRSDDAVPVIEAIKMIRGVLDVKPLVTNAEIYMAQERARRELINKIFEVLKDK